MKSYLSLIPISAKVRRRQSRMTILCIIISVFLVTTIFSVADMMIRTESRTMQDEHGSWHIQIENISEDIAKEIEQRSDVIEMGCSEEFNSDADQPYFINDKKATLYGADEAYVTQLTNSVEEGNYPQNDNEIMLSSNAKLALNVEIGDQVTLNTPAGDTDYIVSGFGSDDKDYYQGQTYLVAVYMTQTTFAKIMDNNGISDITPVYYVQFQEASKASNAIPEIQKEYSLAEDSISENTAIMGISGQSSNESVKNIYGIAAVLFILVLLAGVLMISGSMNSNVAQRTKFFGMMRCIGASRKQIINFVRLEALNWCKTAVPIGLVLGILISWVVCALLHYGIGGEFSATPVFALSPIGLISGLVVGTVTVLLAAQSPAKRASKVSPMSAVSGNTEATSSVKHASKLRFGKIENILGVHHATSSKKNWILMTASFSLSIILLLCFSVGLDFAHELVPSLRSWQPDLTLNGYANSMVLDRELENTIKSVPGVENVFGSSYMDSVAATSSRQGVDHVNLTSYSDTLLSSAKDSVIEGDISKIYGESHQAITISNKDNPLKVGDVIQIGGKEVEITCSVSEGLYSSEYSVICSRETFEWLTGEQNYSLIGIQLDEDATDTTVQQINNLVEGDVIFDDLRVSNQEDRNTYMAAEFVMYSFLAIIAMITIFNIINSISMSVTARVKQYGSMRAVGMDGTQLTRMIASESFTYAISGIIVGCGIGIPLSRFLHTMLLTRYFGTAWTIPGKLIAIIIVFGIISAIAATYVPAKHMRNMAITDTINDL